MHDNGHLFSGYDFQNNVLGYAGVQAMCKHASSGGINQVPYPMVKFEAEAVTIAHELGHNLAMRHDNPGECAACDLNTTSAVLSLLRPLYTRTNLQLFFLYVCRNEWMCRHRKCDERRFGYHSHRIFAMLHRLLRR